MKRLATGTSRHLPYESVWSKQNFFCLINQQNPRLIEREIRRYLACKSSWSPYHERIATGNRSNAIDSTTSSRSPLSRIHLKHWLSWAFAPIRLPGFVRNCPNCAESAYHSYWSNFIPLAKCPIHNEPLKRLPKGPEYREIRQDTLGDLGGWAWNPPGFCLRSRPNRLPRRALALFDELNEIVHQIAKLTFDPFAICSGRPQSISVLQDHTWSDTDITTAFYLAMEQLSITPSTALGSLLQQRPDVNWNLREFNLFENTPKSSSTNLDPTMDLSYPVWAVEKIEECNRKL